MIWYKFFLKASFSAQIRDCSFFSLFFLPVSFRHRIKTSVFLSSLLELWEWKDLLF